MKETAVLVNTARGRLVSTVALLDALDGGRLAGYAADVYEGERGYFHQDFSTKAIEDKLLDRLKSHPKVLLTAHQGFLTHEPLNQVARGLLDEFTQLENPKTSHLTRTTADQPTANVEAHAPYRQSYLPENTGHTLPFHSGYAQP